MRERFFFLLGMSFVAAMGVSAGLGGCGGSIEIVPPGEDGGGGHHDGGHAVSSSSSGSGGAHDAGGDVLPDYVDPGCPDAGAPKTMFACDPYNQGNGDCPPAQGCYIYVQYPSMPCGQEVYGARCAPVGQGGQGEPCHGAQDCGAGFACVVSGSGTQCVELCELAGTSGCPDGYVCDPIDVKGFGGCL